MDNRIIGYDFQGWPLVKQTWKDIFERLGFSIGECSLNMNSEQLQKLMELFPEIMEDDGMGYSPYSKYVIETDNPNRLWVEYAQDEAPKEYRKTISEDSYTRFGWPDVQPFMEKEWWKEVGFDASLNCWFVPTKYLINNGKSKI